jgi:hypothetical protein
VKKYEENTRSAAEEVRKEVAKQKSEIRKTPTHTSILERTTLFTSEQYHQEKANAISTDVTGNRTERP